MPCGPLRTLRIRHPEHLAHRLGLPLPMLQDVAEKHSRLYKTYDKNIGGKTRHLFDPNESLRTVLIAIKCLLRELAIPPEIIGGRPGRNVRQFAEVHVNKPWILKLDIRNFYPSVRQRWVYNMFLRDLRCSQPVAALLTGITTAEDHLPQGFNTSTDIGNLMIRECTTRLADLADQQGFALTIWIDNIVMSGEHYPLKLKNTAERIIGQYGFALNEPELVPNSKPQTICGVTVNTTLSAERSKRELLEATIQEINAGRICAVCERDAGRLRQSLLSKIGAVGQIKRQQARKLRHMLNTARANWACRCA